MILLAIETTCDETAAAVLEAPDPPAVVVPRILASVVASQVGLHLRYGGVVPEIASRAHVRQILPMIDEALRQCGGDEKRSGGSRRGDAAGARRRLGCGVDRRQGIRLAPSKYHSSPSTISRDIFTPASSHILTKRYIPASVSLFPAAIPVFTGAQGQPNPRSSAERPMMRPARRSTRLPACWD